MSLIKDLNWRYAAKNMNGEKVSQEKLNTILDAVTLSASSYGLQPYTVVVVSNEAVKEKLMAAAYGQKQVGSASHVLVFCVPEIITVDMVQDFINHVATTRGLPVHVLDGYKGMITGSIVPLPHDQQQHWSEKQAYIALGTALAAAAQIEVDSCPMEGFSREEFDKILGLEEKGLKSVVIMPIGFRATDDATAHYAKVRKPKELLFQHVN